MDDRRVVTRWQINRKISVKLAGAETSVACHVKDLNLKGMQIALAMKLKADAFLKMHLQLDEHCNFDIEAWLVWHKVVDGINHYGVYFTRIKDSCREDIYNYLRREIPRQMGAYWWHGRQEEGEEVNSNMAHDDKRVFERFSVKFPAKFLNVNSNQEGLVQTLDISAKGIGLTTTEELPLHASVELWLEIPDQGEPLYTRGAVVWAKQEQPNEYRAGINLERADLMGLSRVLRSRHSDMAQ